MSSISRLNHFIFTLVLLFYVIAPAEAKNNAPLRKIAFGGCLIPEYIDHISPKLAQSIVNRNPDLFIFMGDVIYHDLYLAEGDPVDGKYKYFSNKYIAHDNSLSVERWQKKLASYLPVEKYKKDLSILAGTAFYQTLKGYFINQAKHRQLAQNIDGVPGIVGIWDDHDYGYNDSGRLHPKYAKYKEIYQQWIGKNHLGVKQRGLYASYLFGQSPQRTQVLLLDLRSFKTEHRELKEGKEGVLLGSEQWQWLSDELKKPAQLRIIVSSIPMIPDSKGNTKERWSMFPEEKLKMMGLLSTIKDSTIAIASGDWHVPYISVDQKSLDHPLYEFTVGSLGHGEQIKKDRFKTPNEHIVPELRERELAFLGKKPPNNFGLIEIEWEKKQLKYTVVDLNGQSLGDAFTYAIPL